MAQAIGSDRLQGDELRSILENIPRVGQALANGLNVPFQQLRKLGEQGQLTAETVVRALQSQIGVLQDEFASFVPSISFALTRLDNAFLKFVGTTDQAAGVSRSISRAIIFLADNFDTLATAVLTATAVLLGGALTRALLSINVAARAAAAGFALLWTVIVANPIGAFVTVLAAGAAALVGFQDKIRPFENEIVTLGDAFQATGEIISEELQGIGIDVSVLRDSFVSGFNRALEVTEEFRQRLLGTMRNLVNNMIGAVVAGINVLELVFDAGLGKIYQATLVSAQNFWNRNIEIVENGVNVISGLVGVDIPLPRYDFASGEAEAVARDLEDQYRAIIDDAFNTDFIGEAGSAITGAFDNVIGQIKDRATAIAETRQALADAAQASLDRVIGGGAPQPPLDDDTKRRGETTAEVIRQLTREFDTLNVVLGLTTIEGEKYSATQDIINRQLDNNRTVTADQARQIEALVGNLNDANRQLSTQRGILQTLNGPAEDYADTIQALDSLYSSGLISLEQYNQALRDNRIALLESQTTASAGFERSILKFEKDIRDTASQVDNLFSSAFRSAEDAFVEFTKTGQLSFKQLADSIIADITRIAFRETVANLVFGAGGGADGLFSLIGQGLGAFAGAGGGGAGAAAGALNAGWRFS